MMEHSDLSEENSEENKIMKSENNEVSVSFMSSYYFPSSSQYSDQMNIAKSKL